MCLSFLAGLITFIVMIFKDYDFWSSLAGAVMVFVVIILIKNIWK